jgi:hypothetical protein
LEATGVVMVYTIRFVLHRTNIILMVVGVRGARRGAGCAIWIGEKNYRSVENGLAPVSPIDGSESAGRAFYLRSAGKTRRLTLCLTSWPKTRRHDRTQSRALLWLQCLAITRQHSHNKHTHYKKQTIRKHLSL